MNRKFPALMLAALTLMAAGGKQMSKTAPASRAILEAYAASTQRYIAERHKLEIIAPEAELLDKGLLEGKCHRTCLWGCISPSYGQGWLHLRQVATWRITES